MLKIQHKNFNKDF